MPHLPVLKVLSDAEDERLNDSPNKQWVPDCQELLTDPRHQLPCLPCKPVDADTGHAEIPEDQLDINLVDSDAALSFELWGARRPLREGPRQSATVSTFGFDEIDEGVDIRVVGH
jgi:hypothetical protein